MFRRVLLALTFVSALSLVGMTLPGRAEAHGYRYPGSYIGVGFGPGYATYYGYRNYYPEYYPSLYASGYRYAAPVVIFPGRGHRHHHHGHHRHGHHRHHRGHHGGVGISIGF